MFFNFFSWTDRYMIPIMHVWMGKIFWKPSLITFTSPPVHEWREQSKRVSKREIKNLPVRLWIVGQSVCPWEKLNNCNEIFRTSISVQVIFWQRSLQPASRVWHWADNGLLLDNKSPILEFLSYSRVWHTFWETSGPGL